MNRLTAAALLLAPALLFVGCSKGSNSSTTTTTTTQATTTPASSTGSMVTLGVATFNANCATCHGSKGQGQPGAFPPLDGNPVVTGDIKPLIKIVKTGLTGPVKINGVAYNGQMPAWSGTLSDAKLSAVITYIRGAWSNHAGAVTAAAVAAVK
ncbi:MAG: cytochrome c [Candidatus Eremiobacteraeota bacterium]|nr:cytochrome c [Candidatus Eremiobacteraeota bacterium]